MESDVVSDWSMEEISEEEFVEIYYEMTGLDFLKRIQIFDPFFLMKRILTDMKRR